MVRRSWTAPEVEACFGEITHPIRLRVTDNKGLTAIATSAITVRDEPTC